MRFSFEHLGVVRRADIEIGNLTVLCGANNTGKTYITYAVWALAKGNISYSSFEPYNFNKYFSDERKEELNKQLKENQQMTIDLKEIEDKLKEIYLDSITKKRANLHTIFNADKKNIGNYIINPNVSEADILEYYGEADEFEFSFLGANSETSSILVKKEAQSSIITVKSDDLFSLNSFDLFIIEISDRVFYKKAILFTAQRDSIQLFYRALDRNNSDVLQKIRQTKNLGLLDDLPRFARPLEANINFAREIRSNSQSFLAKEYPEIVAEIENLLGVEFMHNQTTNETFVKDKASQKAIPDYLASTSVRALMHLHYWLKHSAQKGDLLMIDEPELNLHPRNQIKMARLFAKLVNVGIKVWITTHSDYIVKELNNLVMLGSVENPAEMCQKLGYQTNEILKAEDLRAYIAEMKAEGAEVRAVTIDPQYGMEESAFDFEIVNTDKIANQLAQHIKPIPTNEA